MFIYIYYWYIDVYSWVERNNDLYYFDDEISDYLDNTTGALTKEGMLKYQAKNGFGVNVTEVVRANISYDERSFPVKF